jgi:hypothetical protein
MFDFSLPVTIVVDFIHEYYMCVATPAAVVGCCASAFVAIGGSCAGEQLWVRHSAIIYDCVLLKFTNVVASIIALGRGWEGGVSRVCQSAYYFNKHL